tara:strand:- start:633 stop:1016 length:384 start_codon:yes stop_codon:yes gene_type:complete
VSQDPKTGVFFYGILLIVKESPTMRKIERQMNTAIRERRNWAGSNTTVMINENNNKAKVYLHGNLIAEVCDEFVAIFDGGWQSVTTKSRLNALLDEFRPHVGVVQRNFDWFIVVRNKYFPFISGSLV